MKILLLIIIPCTFSCHSSEKKAIEINNKEKTAKDALSPRVQKIPSKIRTVSINPFLDSVARQFELSKEQIRKYCLIDSIYYTRHNSRAVFTGDTIYNLKNNIKGAIIICDDRLVCLYKFLVLFNPKLNRSTYNKIIQMDCDQDYSSNYTTLDYEFINDSTFKLIETFMPANSEDEPYKNEITKTVWKINSQGMIIPASKKIQH